MKNGLSYSIRMIPSQETFIVCYSRPSFYGGNWKHYQKDGKYIEFVTWDDAFNWLVERNGGNAAYVVAHLVDTYVQEETVEHRARHITESKDGTATIKVNKPEQYDLFTAILDAHRQHKDELNAQQMFYFLRGVLYQWCMESGESVMELEDLFIGDIRYISTNVKVR